MRFEKVSRINAVTCNYSSVTQVNSAVNCRNAQVSRRLSETVGVWIYVSLKNVCFHFFLRLGSPCRLNSRMISAFVRLKVSYQAFPSKKKLLLFALRCSYKQMLQPQDVKRNMFGSQLSPTVCYYKRVLMRIYEPPDV